MLKDNYPINHGADCALDLSAKSSDCGWDGGGGEIGGERVPVAPDEFLAIARAICGREVEEVGDGSSEGGEGGGRFEEDESVTGLFS